jgi:superfamily I DNA/RNA helicase
MAFRNSSENKTIVSRDTSTPWSTLQKSIFTDVSNGKGHTVVRARAGTGKTTTIIEALNYVPKTKTVVAFAFNKSIARELASRVPMGVSVSTLHSYGYKSLLRAFGKLQIDSDRVSKMCEAMLGKERETFERRRNIEKTVSLAKSMLAHTPEQVDALIDMYGIEVVSKQNDGIIDAVEALELREEFITSVLSILDRCKELKSKCIDFDDMIWLCIALKVSTSPKFDRVFVDETQDLTPSQIELVLSACKPGGRICAIGDDRQAIYTFRGADANTFTKLIERLDAKVLPLSVTYRCAKKIVAIAKTIVPDYEAGPTMPEGTVNYGLSPAAMVSTAGPGDFILSRSNAPLIGFCLQLLRAGKRANIQGRDIGTMLASFVERAKCKTVVEFLDYVDTWKENEVERLLKKNRDPQNVEDRAETLIALCEGLVHTADVVARIKKLFEDSDSTSQIILSSTHKAKGLERERVYVLNDTYRRHPGVEEDNLYYVAVTRAKRVLNFVNGVSGEVGAS